MSTALDIGLTCGDCIHAETCFVLYQIEPSADRCSFEPVRFVRKAVNGNLAGLAIGLQTPVTEVQKVIHDFQMKEDRLMPSRLLHSIIAAMIPATGGPWVSSAIVAGASIGTLFVPVNAILKWLAVSIVFDLFTGFLCKRSGFKRPHISMVGAAATAGSYAVAQYLARQPELQWEVMGRTWGVGEFFALWFLIGHLANITKNMDDLDTPFPKSVNGLISKIRSIIDTAEIGGPIVSIFKSSMSQKGGDTEIVSKTETVVTTTTPTEKP